MIYTFYSFKGGVGRSMALANVAEVFVRRGLRVLVVDFDLEAPGIERYYAEPGAEFKLDDALDHPGLIDLLISYRELREFADPAGSAHPSSEPTVEERIARLPVEPGGIEPHF
jgi:cellulose biosynthesis protein BcsQ